MNNDSEPSISAIIYNHYNQAILSLMNLQDKGLEKLMTSAIHVIHGTKPNADMPDFRPICNESLYTSLFYSIVLLLIPINSHQLIFS